MKTVLSNRTCLLTAVAVLALAGPSAEARQGVSARGGADAGAPVTLAPRAGSAGHGLKQPGAASGGIVRIAPRGAHPAGRGSIGSGSAIVPRVQRPPVAVTPVLRPAVRAPVRAITPSVDVPRMARRTPGVGGSGRLSTGTALQRPVPRPYQTPVYVEPIKPLRTYSYGLDADCGYLWRRFKSTGQERWKTRYYACKG